MSDRSNDCPRKIGILGAGSFGTALAVHLAGVGGHPVRLWARDPDLARRMAEERANPQYLPDVELPPGIVPTSAMTLIGVYELPGATPSLLISYACTVGDGEAVLSHEHTDLRWVDPERFRERLVGQTGFLGDIRADLERYLWWRAHR